MITYMFYKVIIDSITFGLFKAFLALFMILGFFLFFNHKSIYQSDFILLVEFICFSFFIIFRGLELQSVYLKRAIYEYIMYMMLIFAGAYVARSINTIEIYDKVVYIGILLPITSLVDILLNQAVSSYRTTGLARSEMAQGMLLGIFCIILFYYYYKKRSKNYLLIMLLDLLALITTGSRGPLVATVVSLFFVYVYFQYTNNNTAGIIRVFFIVLFLMILLVWFFSTTITTGNQQVDYMILRLQNIIEWGSDAGNAGRLAQWERWLNVFKKNLLFGIGPSRTGSWNTMVTLGVTESGHIRHLVELGLIGSLFYYLPLLLCLKKGIRGLFSKNNDCDKGMIVLHVAIILCVIIEDFVLQITEEITVAFFLWWSLGIIYGLSSRDHYRV